MLSFILVHLSLTFIHFYSNCSFIFDTYSINLCLGYQLFIICPLIPLYFSVNLHRHSSIYLPNVWILPSESFLPFCLVQEYSYLCGQGRDVTKNDSGCNTSIAEWSYWSHAHTASIYILSSLSKMNLAFSLNRLHSVEKNINFQLFILCQRDIKVITVELWVNRVLLQ